MAGLDSGRARKVGERGGWGLASSESGVAVPVDSPTGRQVILSLEPVFAP